MGSGTKYYLVRLPFGGRGENPHHSCATPWAEMDRPVRLREAEPEPGLERLDPRAVVLFHGVGGTTATDEKCGKDSIKKEREWERIENNEKKSLLFQNHGRIFRRCRCGRELLREFGSRECLSWSGARLVARAKKYDLMYIIKPRVGHHSTFCVGKK